MVGPLASPAFRPHFLGPWAENQISFFQTALLFPKGITQSPCPKTLEGDRFGAKGLFRGLALIPRVPGFKPPTQKFLAKAWVDPENLVLI